MVRERHAGMSKKTCRTSWQTRYSVNSPPRSFRELMGATLRRLADRLDGRVSLAVRLTTTPDIGGRRRAACLRKGMEHAIRLADDEAKERATESAMRELNPELFE